LRLAIASVAALLVFALNRRHPQLLALDFTWHWRAARAILAGENPYLVIKETGPYPFSSGYVLSATGRWSVARGCLDVSRHGGR
jgi:hypothetical protein